jgi:hypothetical protein
MKGKVGEIDRVRRRGAVTKKGSGRAVVERKEIFKKSPEDST